MGWTLDITVSQPNKYIICLAPHTSNWDFLIGELYSHAEGIKINFLMKKEWFFYPLNLLWKRLGGIPVRRWKSANMTDCLAEEAMKSDRFCLCITPEGTRSLNTEWKKGFYYIALNAKIPILLYGIDYKKREITCTKSVTPTGDIDKEMNEIKAYFKGFNAKKPKQFSIGQQ